MADRQAVEEAVSEIEQLILARDPMATFVVGEGDDPPGTYVTATVDVDDLDEIIELDVDQTIDIQLERGLALHFIPVRTPERRAAARRAVPNAVPIRRFI